MIFSLASFKWGVPVSVAMLAMQAVCWGQNPAKPQKGRSIEFSDSAGIAAATNLNLGSKSEQLKEWEKDVVKPFESFNAKSSLDGVTAPPPMFTPPASPQSKKYKELLERRKNWVFMTPEDMTAGPTTAEIFNLPDYDENGVEKKEQSALDRFYHQMDKRSKAESRRKEDDGVLGLHKKGSSRKEFESEEEDADARGLRESEQSVRKMFEGSKIGDNTLSPLLKPQTLSDVFGFKPATVEERTPAQKARMEEFRQLLTPGSAGSPSLQPFSAPYNAGGGLPDSRSGAVVGGLDSGPLRPSFPSVVGTINPTIGPSLGVKALEGGLKPVGSLAPTRIETPKVNSATPLFTVPQRKF